MSSKHHIENGLLRLSTVLTIVPVSKSTFWQRVKDGKFPAPIKLGPKITAWKAADIYALIDRGVE